LTESFDGAAAEGLGLGFDGDWVGAQVKARTRGGFQITLHDGTMPWSLLRCLGTLTAGAL